MIFFETSPPEINVIPAEGVSADIELERMLHNAAPWLPKTVARHKCVHYFHPMAHLAMMIRIYTRHALSSSGNAGRHAVRRGLNPGWCNACLAMLRV
mmetsp:Transcript_33215/g.84033  ORF Transcript_33215/g.84033 Transcript_33215/m.84033 type:complete len:97 (+) Transcript_33215:160-450(+)